MESMWHAFCRLLVYVINLGRQPARATSVKQLLQRCEVPEVTMFKAVDGHELLASGGRSRRNNRIWRLTHDEHDGVNTVRVSRQLRASSLAISGGTDLWAQYGCARSHWQVLGPLQPLLSDRLFILVCEDDIALGPAFTDGKPFMNQLFIKLQSLTAAFPMWCCVLLGGRPIYSHGNRNKMLKVPRFRSSALMLHLTCNWCPIRGDRQGMILHTGF